MHKLKYIVLSLIATAFIGCDEIKEGDRYIEMEQVTAKRAVLLEEFTGQRCSNCPDAHEAIKMLKEQYGEALITVGIHAGNFGIAEGMSSKITGLMQPEGDEYAIKWDVQTYPSGVINRASGAIGMDAWAASIRAELEKESPLSIELSATNNSEDNSIEISTIVKPSSDVVGKLQLWVVESGIVAMQLNGRTTISDYVHDHVYRASVNGTWGEDVSLSDNIYEEFNHSISVKDNWNVDNLEIVAFVYDESGVVQVAQTHVVPAQTL